MCKPQTLLLGVMLGVLAGCGSATTAPVSGIVTLDGEPVFPARIIFSPQLDEGTTVGDATQVSTTTEADGSYSIENAPIGDVFVGVMMLPDDEDSEEAEDNERPEAAGKPEKDSYTVTSGENEIDIKLVVPQRKAAAGNAKGRGGRRRSKPDEDEDDD